MRHVAVCIATRHRVMQLEQLLAALQSLVLPADCTVEVRVVDNDPGRSAEHSVASFAATAPQFRVHYAVEPLPGVVPVRNRAIEVGPADLLAFIDDDEWPTPSWLVDLVEALDRQQADAVIGPVLAHIPVEVGGAPWRQARFRSAPCAPWGPVDWSAGRTGNVLVLGRWFYERGFRFDPAFAQTGGEDADLFSRLDEAGALLCSSAATVHEHVSAERLSLRWLVRRQVRCGMNYERIKSRRADAHHPIWRIGGHTAQLAARTVSTVAEAVGARRVDGEALVFLLLTSAWVGGLARQQWGLAPVLAYGRSHQRSPT